MRGKSLKCAVLLAMLPVLAGIVGAAPAPDEPNSPPATPVVAAPTTSPAPVRMTDGRFHLVYELLLTNSVAQPATLKSVEVLDADRAGSGPGRGRGRVVERLAGAGLAERFRPVAGDFGSTVLAPSQVGAVWLDVSAPTRAGLPRQLTHRIRLSFPRSPAPGFIDAQLTETVGETAVSRRPAPVITPPLSGSGWIDGEGCCSPVESHHMNALAGSDNSLKVSTRFAIDYEQFDRGRRFYTGDPGRLAHWKGYGAPVLAVSDGTIVEAVDGLPEQAPLQPPHGVTRANVTGNHVIERFTQHGFTYFAYFAHLRTGSVRKLGLHAGQRVRAGQTIGQVGNTGSSSAPHLHFEIADRPNLAADALPYAFTAFALEGRAASRTTFFEALESGKPLPLDPHGPVGRRTDESTLSLDITRFPRV